MDYRGFYKDLIKMPMPLSTREYTANILASRKRIAEQLKWQSILTKKDKFSKSLLMLRKNGYLEIKMSQASKLASTLKEIEHEPPTSDKIGETVHLKGVENLEIVKSIENDINLYTLVSLYLNAPAHLHTTQAWWQYPMGNEYKASNNQRWHRDRDDFKELKLFFYATDVNTNSGPHGYIPMSHNSNNLNDIFEKNLENQSLINGENHSMMSDKNLDELGLKVKPHMWLGRAGTCFLEDTSGLHKAYIPTNSPRLIFSILWTISEGWNPNIQRSSQNQL